MAGRRSGAASRGSDCCTTLPCARITSGQLCKHGWSCGEPCMGVRRQSGSEGLSQSAGSRQPTPLANGKIVPESNQAGRRYRGVLNAGRQCLAMSGHCMRLVDEFYDPRILLVLGLFTAIGFMVGAAFGGFLRADKAAEWASAIGTIAAAVIAVSIALAEGFRRRREERSRAVLAAARILPPLTHATDRLRNLCALMDFRDVDLPEGVDVVRQMEQLRTLGAIQTRLAEPAFQVPQDLISQLMPLRNRAAVQIAAGCGLLEQLAKEVGAVTGGGSWTKTSLDARDGQLRGWQRGLQTACDHLRIGLVECQRAAGLASVAPTGEELYGE
jgi:hypothetical protein